MNGRCLASGLCAAGADKVSRVATMTTHEIEALLPAVCGWVAQQENMILKMGEPS
jgi:hypothetical protein